MTGAVTAIDGDTAATAPSSSSSSSTTSPPSSSTPQPPASSSPPPPPPPSAASSPSSSRGVRPAFFTGQWAQRLRWRLFNARNRWRARSALDRVRSSASAVIPFRFPSSPASSSLLSIPDAVRHIFNPSLVSKMTDLPFSAQLLLRWRRILHALLPLGGSSSGNRVTVYADGDDAFTAMWAAIEAATQSIRMETYILEPDAIGVRTMQLLADAARRGVDVALIYDSVGSSALLTDWTHISALAETGAVVVQFNPILSWPWRRRFLFRNHRKVLVVDERVGFTGGMNIGKEYCGRRLGGTAQFRDTHLRVEGPAVFDLLQVFEDSYTEALPNAPVPVYRGRDPYRKAQSEKLAKMEGAINTRARQLMRRMVTGKASLPPLHEPTLATHAPPAVPPTAAQPSSATSSSSSSSPSAPPPQAPNAVALSSALSAAVDGASAAGRSDKSVPVTSFWPAPVVESSALFVQVLKSNIWRSSRLIQRAMIITLQSARYRAYITTPYFVPPTRLRQALLTAASKGVDVRLLTSGRDSDVPWSRWASIHIYSVLLRRGVRIWELQHRMLHAKTVAIDGVYASVGSFNFDRLSVLNLEVNLTTLDPDIAAQVETQFFMDLLDSKEVKEDDLQQRNWAQRLLHWICYRLALLIA